MNLPKINIYFKSYYFCTTHLLFAFYPYDINIFSGIKSIRILLQYKVPCPEDSPINEANRIRTFYDLLLQSMDVLKTWADRIPGFGDLPHEDQELLFQSATMELFVLRMAYRLDLFWECTMLIKQNVSVIIYHLHPKGVFYCFLFL